MPTLRRLQRAAPVILLLVAPVFAHAASLLTRSAHVSGPPQTFTLRITVTDRLDSPGGEGWYDCVPTSWDCYSTYPEWPFVVDFGPLPGDIGVVHDAWAYFTWPHVEITASVTEQGPLQEWCGEPGEEYPCEFWGGFYDIPFYDVHHSIYLVGGDSTYSPFVDLTHAAQTGQTSFDGYFSVDLALNPCIAYNAIAVCQIDFNFIPEEITGQLHVEYTPAAIPEPGTAALAAICLLALAKRMRKRWFHRARP